MKRTTVSVRLALLSVAVLAMLVALPATAMASKASTKFVVTSSRTIDHDTATTDLWPVAVTAKLQRKSGSHYVALKSGTVKLYYYDYLNGKYVYASSARSSSTGVVNLSIPRRGKYKLYYAGSSTLKSATGYTTVRESIGAVIGEPTLQISGSPNYVTLTYAVTWNTAAYNPGAPAYDMPIYVQSRSQFQDTDDEFYTGWDAYVNYSREIWGTRSVEFRYSYDIAELSDYLCIERSLYSIDPYVVTPDPIMTWESMR